MKIISYLLFTIFILISSVAQAEIPTFDEAKNAGDLVLFSTSCQMQVAPIVEENSLPIVKNTDGEQIVSICRFEQNVLICYVYNQENYKYISTMLFSHEVTTKDDVVVVTTSNGQWALNMLPYNEFSPKVALFVLTGWSNIGPYGMMTKTCTGLVFPKKQ